MFVKIFKLCLCESGKNFKLCLCKFFYLSPFVSKCHTLPKVLSDGPINRQQTCFKVLQIGGGGGGGEETDLWGGDAGWMSRAYRDT